MMIIDEAYNTNSWLFSVMTGFIPYSWTHRKGSGRTIAGHPMAHVTQGHDLLFQSQGDTSTQGAAAPSRGRTVGRGTRNVGRWFRFFSYQRPSPPSSAREGHTRTPAPKICALYGANGKH